MRASSEILRELELLDDRAAERQAELQRENRHRLKVLHELELARAAEARAAR